MKMFREPASGFSAAFPPPVQWAERKAVPTAGQHLRVGEAGPGAVRGGGAELKQMEARALYLRGCSQGPLQQLSLLLSPHFLSPPLSNRTASLPASLKCNSWLPFAQHSFLSLDASRRSPFFPTACAPSLPRALLLQPSPWVPSPFISGVADIGPVPSWFQCWLFDQMKGEEWSASETPSRDEEGSQSHSAT